MNLKFERALKEEELIKDIVSKLGWNYLNTEQIRCLYSYNSSSRYPSRVWGTQKIFSDVFKIEPAYVIELMQPKFDELNYNEQIQRLIIPLLGIPKTFSGEIHHTLKYYDNKTKKQKRYTLEDIQNLCNKVTL